MTRAVPEPFFNFAVSGAGGLPGLGQGSPTRAFDTLEKKFSAVGVNHFVISTSRASASEFACCKRPLSMSVFAFTLFRLFAAQKASDRNNAS